MFKEENCDINEPTSTNAGKCCITAQEKRSKLGLPAMWLEENMMGLE